MIPPVLCYHRVGGPLELGVTRVSPRTFRRQMEALAAGGWRTLTLHQYAESLRATHPVPRTLLLTFDDGYENLTTNVYPVLADLGFTGTTFLITDYVGLENTWDMRYTWKRLRHLDWTAVEYWQARGFDFASHGATHRRLTWLDDAAAEDELHRSRTQLGERLGAAAAMAIAYPFGAVDSRIAVLARGCGYALGFSGPRGDRGQALNLPRTPVYAWDRGAPPFGLRADRVGRLGRGLASFANRCAVGTSWMLALRRVRRRGSGDLRLTPNREREQHRTG